MQYLAEKTRQALGLGDRDFRPTSLEAEHRAVHDANVYGHQLHTLERALAKWAAATDDVLCSAGHFLTDAPRPRHFAQLDPCDPATLTAAPPELPPQFIRLNQPSLLRRLAAGTRLAVGDILQLGLEDPIAVWLAALEAAKERLSGVEHMRIRYDAARRALHNASRAPEADELGTPAHLLLIQLEQEHEPVMSEFRDAQEALDRHLTWLVDGAARLKAAVAAALQVVNAAALGGALMPPEGLLRDFPRDLLERPETLRTAAAAPAGPAAAAAAGTAAAMTEAAVEAATSAAITASGLDVPPPQLVMLGPDVGGDGGAGGTTDVVMVVPPGTVGVATEAAVQAAAAVGRAAAEVTALTAPRLLREREKMEERLLQASSTGGPGAARLYKLVTRPDRRAAVRAAWRSLVQMVMYAERHKTLAQHAKEQMQDVRERAGLTGGFLMRAEAAPEYVLAGRRRVPGGGPLQFLRDTLLGPPAPEPQPQRPLAASATAAAGGSGGAAVTHTLTAPETAHPNVNYAAAAGEQMEEVATHGPGDTPSTAFLYSRDSGVGCFISDTAAGPLRGEQSAAAAGFGGGGGSGGGAAGMGGFATEAGTGPSAVCGGVVRPHVSEPQVSTMGGAANLPAVVREQVEVVGTRGPSSSMPPADGVAAGRTASGGPSSFVVDTLLVTEPGPGSYAPPAQPVAGPTCTAHAAVPAISYAQPVEPLLQSSTETASDLAAPVPVPLDTYAAGTMEDVLEMLYMTPASVARAQAANRAAAAMSAADAAMDVAAASMEAATASMDAAVAATAAASVAQEAATDAAVATMNLEFRDSGDEVEATSAVATDAAATVPDFAREYGITGAGGPAGASTGNASEEGAMPAAVAATQPYRAAGTAEAAATRPVAAVPPPPTSEKPHLPDLSGLDVAKHDRRSVPNELSPSARGYAKIGAGGPPGGGGGGLTPISDEEVAAGPVPVATAAAVAKPAGTDDDDDVELGHKQIIMCTDLTSFGLPAGAATVAAVSTVSEPVTSERQTRASQEVDTEAVSEQLIAIRLGGSDLTPTEATKPEADPVTTEAGTGGGLRSESGVPGLFGALKKMLEKETSVGAEGAGEEVRQAHRECIVAEPAGPSVVET